MPIHVVNAIWARLVRILRALGPCRRWGTHGGWLPVASEEVDPDAPLLASFLDYLHRVRGWSRTPAKAFFCAADAFWIGSAITIPTKTSRR